MVCNSTIKPEEKQSIKFGFNEILTDFRLIRRFRPYINAFFCNIFHYLEIISSVISFKGGIIGQTEMLLQPGSRQAAAIHVNPHKVSKEKTESQSFSTRFFARVSTLFAML